ncbi:hypothetical protein ES332_D04G206400v1 [Gossypium tomentosum]|uniref:O-methyltransferase domain-containing protein n=1 Tax=Gossypium tomentosum TaxID=34277 RepID=A0A5D2LJA4_GOSTO|nr:hypothetical protein ES332_D04G206400v1 [Gossypium tomentosum]
MEVSGIEEEEARAEVDIWNYVFGYAKIAVVKCAIELGIANVIENYGSPMPLSELATALRCEPSRLYRIMRFMVHDRIFKQEPINQHTVGFSSTPLSRRLIKDGENSMAPFILLESSPTWLAPWHSLSARATIEGCPEVFDGVESLVDVGGGNGTTLSLLVKAFPWIRGINFDLPHVVAVAPKSGSIENVGGDMFMSIPNADAAFLMWILHDWDDEECIKILKKCREAIPEDKGKVIIVEAALEEDKEDDELGFVGLMLDMAMMAHTDKGKERTLKEWSYVLRQSGFTRFTVNPICAVQSVIEGYP